MFRKTTFHNTWNTICDTCNLTVPTITLSTFIASLSPDPFTDTFTVIQLILPTVVFKKLGILPLYSQYLYSLFMFIAKNRDLFQANKDFRSIGTRYKNDFHLPSAKLKVFQRGAFYSGVKAYNQLPINIKELSQDVKWFKRVLKPFFQTHSFYSVEEYFSLKF